MVTQDSSVWTVCYYNGVSSPYWQQMLTFDRRVLCTQADLIYLCFSCKHRISMNFRRVTSSRIVVVACHMPRLKMLNDSFGFRFRVLGGKCLDCDFRFYSFRINTSTQYCIITKYYKKNVFFFTIGTKYSLKIRIISRSSFLYF